MSELAFDKDPACDGGYSKINLYSDEGTFVGAVTPMLMFTSRNSNTRVAVVKNNNETLTLVRASQDGSRWYGCLNWPMSIVKRLVEWYTPSADSEQEQERKPLNLAAAWSFPTASRPINSEEC